MSQVMEEEIKRWTARRKSALVLEIIQGKTTVAEASRQFVCIIDPSKQVPVLGTFPLPVEVIPMARSLVSRRILELTGGQPVWRQGTTTDNGNWIVDVHNLRIADPPALETALNQIPGVVCVGLFAHRRADVVICDEAETLGINTRAELAAAEAALRAIEDAQHAMAEGRPNPDLYADTASRLMEIYRQRIASRSHAAEDDAAMARRIDEIERRLRLAGLAAEREELTRLARSRQIDEVTARRLIREVDLQELRYV